MYNFSLDAVRTQILATAQEVGVALPYDNIVLSYPVTYPVETSVLLVGVEKLDAIQRSRLSTALAIMLISDPITVAVTESQNISNLPYTSLGCNPAIPLPAGGATTYPHALNVTIQVGMLEKLQYPTILGLIADGQSNLEYVRENIGDQGINTVGICIYDPEVLLFLQLNINVPSYSGFPAPLFLDRSRRLCARSGRGRKKGDPH